MTLPEAFRPIYIISGIRFAPSSMAASFSSWLALESAAVYIMEDQQIGRAHV